MATKPEGYADLHGFDEDARIDLIGRTCVEGGKTVAFVVDDVPDKPDRYVRKLLEKFPGIRVVSRGPGPVAGTYTVKVAPPDPTEN